MVSCASFYFTHFLRLDTDSVETNLKYLLHLIPQTFKEQNLGKVSSISILRHAEIEETANTSKIEQLSIKINFSQWNLDDPLATTIYNKVYGSNDESGGGLPYCANVVYDDKQNKWILWRIDKSVSGNYTNYFVSWKDNNFFILEESKMINNTESDTRKMYEEWAEELNKEGQYSIETEYRYDLMDMIYDPHYEYSAPNGYTAYTQEDFQAYYGENEGYKRWNSNMYSSLAYIMKDNLKTIITQPPNGCLFNNELYLMHLHICMDFTDEKKFNKMRLMLRKYIDILYKFTDPTDDITEQPPSIKLRANLNYDKFSICCQYDYYFSRFHGNKKMSVNFIFKKLRSEIHKNGYLPETMIEWF